MADALRGVIVGAGFFAQFHADGWNKIEDAGIVAVADPDVERARGFASQWGIPRVHASLAEALAIEKPDFVDIITRPDTHLALTREAAQAGVQVICQKPMAPTVADSEEMVRVCREAGVRLFIHENWRWQPWYREVKRLVDAGELGRVFHIGFRLRTGDGRGPEPYTVQPYFREMRRLLVYETLVHFLDTLLFLGGEIESVYCRTQKLNPIIAGEDCGVVTVTFAGGAQGVIDANRIAGPVPPPVAFGEMRLEGDLGAMRMAPDGSLFRTAAYGEAEAPHEFNKPETGYKGESAQATQRHIVECLRSGKRAECEGEQYLKTVKLVEACYESASSGEAVKL